MKVQKYQPSEERTILIGMIVHDGVLGRIASHLNGEKRPFRSKWTNLVAGWCLNHHAQYHRAPKRAIEDWFSRFAESSQDEDTVGLVESFLAGLSDDFKGLAREMNEQFVIDAASRHFRSVRLERTAKKIESSLERNDPEQAEESLKSYEGFQFASTDWIDPFNEEVIKKVLTPREDQELVIFPGVVGEFLSPHLERDGFVVFAGPEKRGKSFWLSEMVWQSVRQRRRTLYYIVGDMSESQVMRRLLCRVARHPLRAGVLQKPTRIRKGEGNEGSRLRTEAVTFEKGLSVSLATKAMKRGMVKTASLSPRLKMRCVESSMISAGQIENDIVDFCRQDWPPDVVVIDYADLLAPEPHCKSWEYRHQINETWKVMRRISQRFHLLLVTATQTARTSYDTTLIKKGDFSEDKRKASHVTGMLGVNQTSDEKKQGIYRLNWVFLRDGAWSDTQTVLVAGNLSLACPCIVSTL